MNKHFVILSQGSYSDYFPYYYMGDIEITQEELTKKAKEIRDFLIDEYEKLPERIEKDAPTWRKVEMEHYSPETNKTIYKPNFEDWLPLMEKWLFEEKKYEKLPDKIAEINVEFELGGI